MRRPSDDGALEACRRNDGSFTSLQNLIFAQGFLDGAKSRKPLLVVKDLARLRPIGWSDDALLFKHIHDAPSTGITYFETTLQTGGRAELSLDDDLCRIP